MARNPRLLTRLRLVALAIWCACVLLVVVPAVNGSSGMSPSIPFKQPVQPPGPHPAIPLKE